MYLVISLLVLMTGCEILWYQFLIIAYLFTLSQGYLTPALVFTIVKTPVCKISRLVIGLAYGIAQTAYNYLANIGVPYERTFRPL